MNVENEQGLRDFRNDSARQISSAWSGVVDLLDRLKPDWYKDTDLTPKEAALKTIEALASRLPQQEWAEVPEGWALVPLMPTEEMWGGLARDIVMAMDMGCMRPRQLFKHLEMCGTEIPQWLRDEAEMQSPDHMPSKGTRATLIYRAMLAAAPLAPASSEDA